MSVFSEIDTMKNIDVEEEENVMDINVGDVLKVGVHTVLNHGINQTDSQSVSVYSVKMSLYVILQVCRL